MHDCVDERCPCLVSSWSESGCKPDDVEVGGEINGRGGQV